MLQLPTDTELYVDDTQLIAFNGGSSFLSATYISDKTAAELSPLVPLLYDRTYGAVSLPGIQLTYHFYGTVVQHLSVKLYVLTAFADPLTGNAIDIVGLVLPWTAGNLSKADIQVDNQVLGTTWLAPNITAPQLNVTYYSLEPSRLDIKNHTLTITVMEASSDNPWLIDYVRVANVQYPASGTSTALSEYDVATSSSIVSSTPSNSTAPAPAGAVSGSSFPLIPVIGGMVGGVVILAILFALLFFLWRRSYACERSRTSKVKGG
ncbi:hypothetical protein NUW54_g11645 [Trametes sanguinea]|uniref:Uncharacterized protein n=1 Tax=Trametes sanguinea TaxID=158606 RepID=A0ACC1NA64_9APHY|nr:hypothetical protein NUW54_g11645 [Trametes sanguinea]